MGVLPEEDLKRKVLDLALQAARKNVSPQTGYVHFCSEDPYGARQDTIPVLENFYYAYALFRSKSVENILEGKNLLEKLFRFEVNGNYPVYLHAFPRCADLELSSRLLPIFFYLTQDFAVALGEELTREIRQCADRIVAYLRTKEDLSKGAHNRLSAFLGTLDPNASYSEGPCGAADFCICLQMAGFSLDRIAEDWDRARGVFIGRTRDRLQEGGEPALTLLDLFMGEHFGEFSARALTLHPIHLRAAIVRSVLIKGVQEVEGPYSVLIEEDKRQCLTVYWGGNDSTHNLTVEAKKGRMRIEEKTLGVFTLLHALGEELPSEEESTECALYVSLQPGIDLKVSGDKATAFGEEDALTVTSPCGEVRVRFSGKNGTWAGHISKANRSFQIKTQGYAAHDLKMGRRTLRRSPRAHTAIEIDLRDLKAF